MTITLDLPCSQAVPRRALRLDRQIGLLLPCNVAARANDQTIVQALGLQVMVTVPEREDLHPSPTRPVTASGRRCTP